MVNKSPLSTAKKGVRHKCAFFHDRTVMSARPRRHPRRGSLRFRHNARLCAPGSADRRQGYPAGAFAPQLPLTVAGAPASWPIGLTGW